MKIAVYTIAKNEEKHAERFATSYKDADHIVVADTGSIDKTVDILKDHGVSVHRICVEPWRFDTARNAALALVPDDVDVCFKTDLDETVSVSWRAALEDEWKVGVHNRGLSRFNSSPNLWYWKNDLHSRHGWLWKFPIHECLHSAKGTSENAIRVDERFQTWHHPDIGKSRNGYLQLLDLAVAEFPEATQLAYWHARQFYLEGLNVLALEKLKAYLDKHPLAWAGERAAAMEHIATIEYQLGNPNEAMQWLYRACAEAPFLREGWCALAKMQEKVGLYEEAYGSLHAALRIQDCNRNYLINPECWDERPRLAAAALGAKLGIGIDAPTDRQVIRK